MAHISCSLEDEMGRESSRNGEEDYIYDVGGKDRKKKTTRKTNNNIKMDLGETG
jgi:hypothetical protein